MLVLRSRVLVAATCYKLISLILKLFWTKPRKRLAEKVEFGDVGRYGIPHL